MQSAKLARDLGDTPVISVGGFRSGKAMEEALRSGSCDLTALSRPLIAEPDFVQRIAADLEYQAVCTNCNQCAIMCDTPNRTFCYNRGSHERE